MRQNTNLWIEVAGIARLQAKEALHGKKNDEKKESPHCRESLQEMVIVKLQVITVFAAGLALAGAHAEQNLREATDVDSVSCVVGPWKYSECASGKQVRTRDITVQPLGQGKTCPSVKQEIPCEPVPCKVGEWSDFSECDDNGFKKRTRTVEQPLYGGAACPRDEDIVRCKSTKCRVCGWSEWKCDKPTWKMKRTRHITVQPQNGGEECPVLEEFGDICGPPVDCVCHYDDGGDCDADTGTLPTKLVVTKEALDGGSCPTKLSGTKECPVDCKYTLSERGVCYKKTGKYADGKYYQNRKVKVATQPKNGGKTCPTSPIVIDCIDCVFKTSDIPKEKCNYGKQWKYLTILNIPSSDGTQCPTSEPASGGKRKIQVDC